MIAEDPSDRNIDFKCGERAKQRYFDKLACDIVVTCSKLGEAIIQDGCRLRIPHGVFLYNLVDELGYLYLFHYKYPKEMVFRLITNIFFSRIY